MKESTYAIEAEVEATHWWFTERRRLFGRIISALRLPADAKILDIGTSTGTNLRMLRDMGFSNFEGVDMSQESVRWCDNKGLGHVTLGDVCDLPYADASFDLILATDIIEHVDDDAAALVEIRRVLRRGGFVLVTVPAFASLWGLQDDVSLHKRRYLAREILQRVQQANLQVVRRFYFNYLLFLPIWLGRKFIKLFGVGLKSEAEVNTPFMNAILKGVFRLDVVTAPYVKPPFGVSYLVVGTRR